MKYKDNWIKLKEYLNNVDIVIDYSENYDGSYINYDELINKIQEIENEVKMTQIKFKRIDNYYGKFYIEDLKHLQYNKSVYISKDIVYLLKHTYIFNAIRKYVFEKTNLNENEALLLLNSLCKISNYLELVEMYDIKNV